ncbi:hypothetical protein AMC83_CH01965 [Rhizobium phaseoli]|uniref:hypothetical protein n=1 Tax=Rhizobium phaseoli TaxID=396 RepID=UPI0007F0CA84|nr:hypothetical protein [Rhizobium phaseoli]ANL71948.1 hypothetical protein AMC83_CH01965 [Rhizobium phaseoli]
MTKFLTDNQRLFVQAIAAAAQGRQIVAPASIVSEELPRHQYEAFRNLRPNFHTQWGLLQATFRKAERSAKTGRPIAYYDLFYTDNATGIRWVKTFRYGLKNGAPHKEEEFEWRAQNGNRR